MLPPPVRLSRSLGLAWQYARQRLTLLTDAFGLGPLVIRAFLRRDIRRGLDRELVRLEIMVRRVLFIAAMETPLPLWKPRTAGKGAPVAVQVSEAAPPATSEAPARPSFCVPAFRLIETAGRPRATPEAAPRVPADPDTPTFRPRPDDYVPAADLFNRFVALKVALEDPEGEVARFRRKLARIRADKTLALPLADRLPQACIGPSILPVVRELFWTLHDAALSWLPRLDSG